MFKVSVTILLFLALLTQSLSRGLIVLSYFTNKKAYEQYCVNKNRPLLQCNGQCQMAKKIKAEEERDQKDPLKSSKFSEVVFHYQHKFAKVETLLLFKSAAVNYPQWAMGYTLQMPRSIFHPPNLA